MDYLILHAATNSVLDLSINNSSREITLTKMTKVIWQIQQGARNFQETTEVNRKKKVVKNPVKS